MQLCCVYHLDLGVPDVTLHQVAFITTTMDDMQRAVDRIVGSVSGVVRGVSAVAGYRTRVSSGSAARPRIPRYWPRGLIRRHGLRIHGPGMLLHIIRDEHAC